MIRFFNTILLSLFSFVLVAQTKLEAYKIEYDKIENGKKTGENTQIYVYNQMVFLSKPSDKIQQYIDLKTVITLALLKIEILFSKK